MIIIGGKSPDIQRRSGQGETSNKKRMVEPKRIEIAHLVGTEIEDLVN